MERKFLAVRRQNAFYKLYVCYVNIKCPHWRRLSQTLKASPSEQSRSWLVEKTRKILRNKVKMAETMLSTSQLVSGITVLISFFAGYKYALKCHGPEIEELDNIRKKSTSKAGGDSASTQVTADFSIEPSDPTVSFISQ